MSTSLPPFVWINGEITPTELARLSPFDHGLLVGDGAFETLITYRGHPFAMHRHWLRLEASCGVLDIPVPDEAILRVALLEVMLANQLTDARVRITVTSGNGPLGSDRGAADTTVLIAAVPLKPWAKTEMLITVPWARNERSAIAGVKSTSYAENVVALAYAKKRGGGEALFLNTLGELCEGTGSNVFLVSQGQVVTPPLSSGCLAGVTRGLVIELCRKEGIPSSEAPLVLADLVAADEVFITSSTREVHAVVGVDDQTFKQGPITERLASAFKLLTAAEINP